MRLYSPAIWGHPLMNSAWWWTANPTLKWQLHESRKLVCPIRHCIPSAWNSPWPLKKHWHILVSKNSLSFLVCDMRSQRFWMIGSLTQWMKQWMNLASTVSLLYLPPSSLREKRLKAPCSSPVYPSPDPIISIKWHLPHCRGDGVGEWRCGWEEGLVTPPV